MIGPDETPDAEQRRAEQQLMHALLTGLHEDDAAREDRIAATMKRFEETLVQVQPVAPGGRQGKRRRWVQWIATAAALLVGSLFWNLFTQPAQLTAAVDRVQVAAIEPVTRVYDLRLKVAFADSRPLVRTGRLHTRSTSQFMASVQAGDRSIVLGFDGRQEWFITGRSHGYLSETDDDWLRNPVIEERMHRFMLANQFLQSLSDSYEVELLDDPLPTNYDRPTTALLGRRLADDRRWPDEVRIWADQGTGVAVRVVLNWNAPFRVGYQQVVLDFVGENPVGDDFYTLEHHTDEP